MIGIEEFLEEDLKMIAQMEGDYTDERISIWHD